MTCARHRLIISAIIENRQSVATKIVRLSLIFHIPVGAGLVPARDNEEIISCQAIASALLRLSRAWPLREDLPTKRDREPLVAQLMNAPVALHVPQELLGADIRVR